MNNYGFTVFQEVFFKYMHAGVSVYAGIYSYISCLWTVLVHFSLLSTYTQTYTYVKIEPWEYVSVGYRPNAKRYNNDCMFNVP